MYIIISIKQKILALMKIGNIYVHIHFQAPDNVWYMYETTMYQLSKIANVYKYQLNSGTRISRNSSAGRAKGLI